MQHPRRQFGFYSAIMQKNIQPVLMNIFQDNIGLYHEHMFSIFDQKFCKASPEVTGEKFGFIRDLPLVWSSMACKNFEKTKGIQFGPENTLMLESDEMEVYDCWKNALIIDRYDRDDVWPSLKGEHRDQVMILQSIRNDLFKILDTQKGDIREFLN